MTIEEMKTVLAEVEYPGYLFDVFQDSRGSIYLQAAYFEPDTTTQKIEQQVTRRWFLNPMMTKSEIVQTAFKCILTSFEHRIREWFKYRGRSVYGPHFDVERLWELCGSDKALENRK